jgi:DNA adenine methylase
MLLEVAAGERRIARPPLSSAKRWKWYLAKRIIQHLPEHRFYIEPCAGGLSVFLNKPPCSVEVASDLDAGLIGYYRVLQDRHEPTDRFHRSPRMG